VADAAVGEVLFGEEHGGRRWRRLRAYGAADGLAGRRGVGDVGVVIAADFDEVGGEFFVECFRRVLREAEYCCSALVEHLVYGLVVALPVRAQVSLEGTGWRSCRCRRRGRGRLTGCETEAESR